MPTRAIRHRCRETLVGSSIGNGSRRRRSTPTTRGHRICAGGPARRGMKGRRRDRAKNRVPRRLRPKRVRLAAVIRPTLKSRTQARTALSRQPAHHLGMTAIEKDSHSQGLDTTSTSQLPLAELRPIVRFRPRAAVEN